VSEQLFTNENQYVVFELGRETYGLAIATVREIITMQTITQVPNAAEYVEGVINLRGRVIPVFNLHQKFNLQAKEISRFTRIVVVEAEGNTIGMIVDGVSEVLRISNAIVERPKSIMADVDTEYLAGVAKIEDRLVILLDLDKVLSREDHSMLENVS
jgi:purine-binding chemotaxis protein CheW